MPIIELQRRLREIGRIRLGEQVATSNGKTRPSKLTKFRLTSKDQVVLDAAAAIWGGTVQPWEHPTEGAQFELYTDTASMQVVVPPTEMAFSQWYEQWSAGGCQVRCDGQWDSQGDKPCHCDPENRTCKITTRLSVILPELAGLGVWRVETHGYYAAVELNGAVDVCQQFAGQGRMLPARLRLEPRRVVRPDSSGRAKTHNFAVPVLDVEVNMGQLVAAAVGQAGQLPPGAAGALPAAETPAFTPVAELPPPSLEEQLDAIDQPVTAPPRTNGKAVLPPTGIAPRPAAAAEATAGATVDGAPTCVECGESLAGGLLAERGPAGLRHKGGCPTSDTPKPVEELPVSDPRNDWERQKRRFHAIASKRWPGATDDRETARKAWLTEKYGTDTLKDFDGPDLAAACDALDAEVTAMTDQAPAAAAAGGLPPARTEDGWDYVTSNTWDGDTWRAYAAESGVKVMGIVLEARKLAPEVGVEPPKSIDDLAGASPAHRSLSTLLCGWVEEQVAARSSS